MINIDRNGIEQNPHRLIDSFINLLENNVVSNYLRGENRVEYNRLMVCPRHPFYSSAHYSLTGLYNIINDIDSANIDNELKKELRELSRIYAFFLVCNVGINEGEDIFNTYMLYFFNKNALDFRALEVQNMVADQNKMDNNPLLSGKNCKHYISIPAFNKYLNMLIASSVSYMHKRADTNQLPENAKDIIEKDLQASRDDVVRTLKLQDNIIVIDSMREFISKFDGVNEEEFYELACLLGVYKPGNGITECEFLPEFVAEYNKLYNDIIVKLIEGFNHISITDVSKAKFVFDIMKEELSRKEISLIIDDYLKPQINDIEDKLNIEEQKNNAIVNNSNQIQNNQKSVINNCYSSNPLHPQVIVINNVNVVVEGGNNQNNSLVVSDPLVEESKGNNRASNVIVIENENSLKDNGKNENDPERDPSEVGNLEQEHKPLLDDDSVQYQVQQQKDKNQKMNHACLTGGASLALFVIASAIVYPLFFYLDEKNKLTTTALENFYKFITRPAGIALVVGSVLIISALAAFIAYCVTKPMSVGNDVA